MLTVEHHYRRKWSPQADVRRSFLFTKQAHRSLWFRGVASATGFAPAISCVKGRRVDWATPRGRQLEPQPGLRRSLQFTELLLFGPSTSWRSERELRTRPRSSQGGVLSN